MAIPAKVQEILDKRWKQRHHDLWIEHKSDSELANWHGFAAPPGANRSPLRVFFTPGSDPEPLLQSLPSIDNFQVKPLFIPQFRQMSSGKSVELPNSLQPGSRVSARNIAPLAPETIDSECLKQGPNGTIGAFVGLNPGGMIWLLSCFHILVRLSSCPTINLDIRGADGSLFSNSALFTTKDDGSFLDAALAPLIHPNDAVPIYDKGLELQSDPKTHLPLDPIPVGDLISGTVATKQGNATGVRRGLVLLQCDRVAVLDYLGLTELDCSNELMIGSIKGEPAFLEKGDSGSLVVSDGRPAGILFAKTNIGSSAIFENKDVTTPLGLASPLDVVLNQLSKIVDNPAGQTLKMLPLQG